MDAPAFYLLVIKPKLSALLPFSNIWHYWDSPLKTENIQKCSRVSHSSLWLRFSVASFSLHLLNVGVLQTLGPELLTGLPTLKGTYLLPWLDDLQIDNSSLLLSLQGLLCASNRLWETSTWISFTFDAEYPKSNPPHLLTSLLHLGLHCHQNSCASQEPENHLWFRSPPASI